MALVQRVSQIAMEREFHPYAAIFDLADAGALTKMSQDIRQYGQHEPIVLLEGKILDGRNRYRACVLTGVEPTFVDFESHYAGEDPLEWMVRKNIGERQLSQAQLATVSLSVLNHWAGGSFEMTVNRRQGPGQSGLQMIKDAAALTGAGWSSVERLVAIQKRRPDLIEGVRSGAASVAQASRDAGFNEYGLDESIPGVNEYFGRGDKFREASEPLLRYLRGWANRDYEFRHVNPKEAEFRVKQIDKLLDGLTQARRDLEARTVKASSTH